MIVSIVGQQRHNYVERPNSSISNLSHENESNGTPRADNAGYAIKVGALSAALPMHTSTDMESLNLPETKLVGRLRDRTCE